MAATATATATPPAARDVKTIDDAARDPAPPVAGPRRAARLAAFAALGLYGALPWTGMVAPAATGAALAAVALATAGAALLLRIDRPAGRLGRAALTVTAAILALLLALVGAGVPLRFLVPDAWPDLVVALADGIATTPGVGMPYRGAEAWVRIAIVAGAGALLALGALLVAWPRRGGAHGWPLAAAAVLGILYALPVVEQSPDAPYLSGAGFAILAAALLWADRLPAGRVTVATAAVAAAALAGLLAGPLLDRDRPWLDYEALAEQLEPAEPATYRWDHGYGPLDWPREGREVLRIRAEAPAYWKATTLDVFDGVRWQRTGVFAPDDGTDEATAPDREDWQQTITVAVKNLRSRQLIGAGVTLEIPAGPRGILEAGQGTWIKGGRPLQRGSTYRARVYTPRPSQGDLRSAAADELPVGTDEQRSMELPAELLGQAVTHPSGGRPFGRLRVTFPRFDGGRAEPRIIWPGGIGGDYVQTTGGAEVVDDSAYGRWYRLARELAAESSGLYDFVLNVRDRVRDGAVYTERPTPGRLPLDTFLFDSRAGYCQQFSGAMALLLRMGGVPARVATGFSPGSFDRRRGEYVVRDLDAHSWVEAYLPGIGWHTLDPTPGEAPARSQAEEDSDARNPNAAQVPDLGGGRDLPGDVTGAGAARGADEATSPWLFAGGAAVVLALLAAAALVMRRGRLPAAPLGPELAELQRALHRTGRTPAPDTTLRRLEELVAAEPDAVAYVRTVREARFAGGRGHLPTRRQRRALRRALAHGLGLGGRLRALWALPPRLPRPG